MSNELFLVAHKVRGEPAFDVAIKIDCPECQTQGCSECDEFGYFWIIPTSGHRAYPWWHHPLKDIWMVGDASGEAICSVVDWPDPMPPSLPDHYTTHAAPSRPALADLLPKAKPVKITRRI